MNDQPYGPATDSGPMALPRHTTPTWEVELLISGVAVFAMLQLPGLLDDALFAALPRFDPAWGEPLRIIYMYLKSASVILAATFAIHLLLRANWIALVGMYSVFPDGVRLDALRMGPVQRALEHRLAADPVRVIDRADNRATVVFAIGVTLALMLVGVSLLIVLVFTALVLALALAGVAVDVSAWFLAAIAIAVVPIALAMLVDRHAGHRLAPGSLAARLLEALFRGYRPFGFDRGGNAIAFVASHGGRTRMVLLVAAIFLPVMIAVLVGLKALQSPQKVGGYGLFPEPAPGSARVFDAAHYDHLRDVGRDPAVPFIDDPVVRGPWLRLTVPFQPGADDAALLGRCPEAVAAGDEDADRVLDCLQSIHAVGLDGKPLASLRYDAGSDPRTERPALVAMIDARELAPGRHELRIARAGAEDHGEAAWVIPFWR